MTVTRRGWLPEILFRCAEERSDGEVKQKSMDERKISFRSYQASLTIFHLPEQRLQEERPLYAMIL